MRMEDTLIAVCVLVFLVVLVLIGVIGWVKNFKGKDITHEIIVNPPPVDYDD